AATGAKRTNPSRTTAMLMSSIITTNRNSTITAPTYTSTSAIPRNSASSNSHSTALEKKHTIRNSAACTGLRTVTTASPAPSNMTAAGQKMSVSAEMGIMQSSPVRRVGGAIRCDLRLVLVTHRQQLFLRHDLFAALLEVKVGNTRLDDRVNRARFLAEAAVDALEQVDVV